MPTLQDLRSSIPELRDLDDNTAVEYIRRVHYPDRTAEEIGSRLGVKPVAPTVAPRGVLGAVNDTVIDFSNAAAGGVSSVGNFIAPGNRVSKFIQQNIVEAGKANQSDATRAEDARYAADMEGAQGITDEVGATLGYVTRNPIRSLATAAGSFVGPAAGIKAAQLAARGVGAGATGLARAGLAGGALTGAALSGGDAAGTAYELVIKAGGTEEDAVNAARQASVIPAAVGAAGGLVGADRLFAGAKGFAGGKVSQVLKTGAVEGVQEGIEEGITQYEGQRAAVPFDSSIDPMKGVAGAATMGAALGVATGGGIAALQPERGPLSRSANIATELAVEPIPQAQPVEPGMLAPIDEAGARARMEQQMADDQSAIKLSGRLSKAPSVPPVPGAPAREASVNTLDDEPFADRLTTLRDQLESSRVRQQVRDELGPDALNDILYYTAKADDASLPGKTSDRMLELAETILQRAITPRIPNQPKVEGSAGREALGFDAPPEVPRIGLDTAPTGTMRVDGQGNVAPETNADRISAADRARAAAAPRETVDGMTGAFPQGAPDRPGVMVGDGVLTPTGPRPGDRLNPQGEPFTNRRAAITAQKKAGEGFEVVPVDKGRFVVRQAEPAPMLALPAPAGQEWAAFAPESGTKGVPRADMPQIKAEHRGAMTQFLKGRGITHEQVDLPASELKPTQAEFSPAKVKQAREYVGGDRSILVSSDGHILDGHHQWLAKREAGEPVKAIVLNAPIDQLMAEVKEFPSAEAAEGAPAPNAAAPAETAPAPARVPKAAAPAVAESDQDRSNREWRENYEAVVSAGDLNAIPEGKIRQAANYAAKVASNLGPKAWEGDQEAKTLIDGFNRERELLDFHLKTREKPPAADADVPTLRTAWAKAVADGRAADATAINDRIVAAKKTAAAPKPREPESDSSGVSLSGPAVDTKQPAPPAPGSVMPAGLRVTFGGKTYPVESVEDAQRKWIKFQESADGGASAGVSQVGNGVPVIDGAGRLVARVAYNGRLFDPQDNVIAEAPGRTAMPDGVRDDTAQTYIPPRETLEQARERSRNAAENAATPAPAPAARPAPAPVEEDPFAALFGTPEQQAESQKRYQKTLDDDRKLQEAERANVERLKGSINGEKKRADIQQARRVGGEHQAAGVV